MVVSKRERYVVIAAIAVVGLLLLDRVLVTPLLARMNDLRASVEKAEDKQRENQGTVQNGQNAGRRWREMSAGALKVDAAATESQAVNSIGDWAQQSGMNLASVNPEGQPQREKEFMRVTFRASGTGTMRQIGEFLFRIQSASIPVRVTDMVVNSKKEGMDELTIQLGISTVYLAPDDKNPKSPGAPAPAAR